MAGLPATAICSHWSRKALERSEQVISDAKKLQSGIEATVSPIQGSRPSAVILDECQDVDDALAEIIEISNKKRRKLAREAVRRQKRIEHELGD